MIEHNKKAKEFLRAAAQAYKEKILRAASETYKKELDKLLNQGATSEVRKK